MKRIISLILILAVLFVFTGCNLLLGNKQAENQGETTNLDTSEAGTNDNNDNETNGNGPGDASTDGQTKKIKMKLYFPTKDNGAVPYEEREVEVKDGAVLKAALNALLEGPASADLHKAIPDGTRLLGVNKKDNVAIVDFSEEYNHFGGSVAEIVARVSVVNTLTEFQGIDRVKILVEGKELIGPSGEPFGEMERFALDEKGYPIQGQKKTVTLYFGNSNADKVVPEQREVIVNEGKPIEKVIFEELIKGPQKQGSKAIIPNGTRILSVNTKDGICTLDLSREFVDNHPGGSAGELMTINSIVNSLTELPHVKKVMFLVEGKTRDVFIHLSFDQPFGRNEEIIQK